MGDRVWLYNPHKKRNLTPKLQSYWEDPYTILQHLSAITYELGDGMSRWPCIVHVYRLWAAVEEGHFMWGQPGPPLLPDSEVEGDGEVDNGVVACVASAYEDPEDPENETVSELHVSRHPPNEEKTSVVDRLCDGDRDDE